MEDNDIPVLGMIPVSTIYKAYRLPVVLFAGLIFVYVTQIIVYENNRHCPHLSRNSHAGIQANKFY